MFTFTDSGICGVLCIVSDFAFRCFPLQGVGDLDSVDLQSFQNHQKSFETWPPRTENVGDALFSTPLSLKNVISSISENVFIAIDTTPTMFFNKFRLSQKLHLKKFCIKLLWVSYIKQEGTYCYVLIYGQAILRPDKRPEQVSEQNAKRNLISRKMLCRNCFHRCSSRERLERPQLFCMDSAVWIISYSNEKRNVRNVYIRFVDVVNL